MRGIIITEVILASEAHGDDDVSALHYTDIIIGALGGKTLRMFPNY